MATSTAPRPVRRAARRAPGRALLVVLAVAGTLALAEAAVRVLRLDGFAPPMLLDAQGRRVAELSEFTRFFDPPGDQPPGSLTQIVPGSLVYGWYDRPRWSYFDREGRVAYRINSLGFRDDEFPLAKPPGELRIVAIGDSFTFGTGVRAEDGWVEQLERRLAERRGRPVEVVNAGCAARDRPETYARWVEEEAPKLAPDALIVGVCLNDVTLDLPLYLDASVPQRPWFGGASRLLWVVQQALRRREEGAAVPRPLRIRAFLERGENQWPGTSAGLLAIQQTCRRLGIRLTVVVFPMLSQLQHDYALREVHELVGSLCADHGIEHVDLLETFLGHDERELWVHPTDQHMNDVGHAMVADALARWYDSHPLD